MGIIKICSNTFHNYTIINYEYNFNIIVKKKYKLENVHLKEYFNRNSQGLNTD